MRRESDYAGLEAVSTHELERKLLTRSPCFSEGHLVVTGVLVMQVVLCACSERLPGRTQHCSKAPSAPAPRLAKGWSAQVDAGSVPKTVTSAPSPCTHAWELLLAISPNDPLYCFKNLSLAEAKALPAVIRAVSRAGRGWDSLLGWPWHTWC